MRLLVVIPAGPEPRVAVRVSWPACESCCASISLQFAYHDNLTALLSALDISPQLVQRNCVCRNVSVLHPESLLTYRRMQHWLHAGRTPTKRTHLL
jgi:hypothetical protein